jgi:predicted amidohydrolase
MDATYFETFRVAVEQGADIVILPIADMDEYGKWKALRGIWPRVQEAQVFGLKASLTGWIAGMHFTGKAGVFAPIPLTPEGDGILGISEHFEGSGIVTAWLDIAALYDERAASEYHGDRNPAFESGFLGRVY